MQTAQELRDDLLCGTREIARHIGEHHVRVHRLLKLKELPGTLIGNRWYSSRSALDEHFQGRIRAHADEK